MFKKAIPFVLVSGLVLTGCNNNDDVPDNNETPMENLDDGLRDTTPRVNNGAGSDMDGINNGNDGNNGMDNGIINDGNRNNGDMNGDNTTAPNDDILTDDNTTTPNDTDTNRDRKNKDGTTGNNNR